jgi:hypothetical protein
LGGGFAVKGNHGVFFGSFVFGGYGCAAESYVLLRAVRDKCLWLKISIDTIQARKEVEKMRNIALLLIALTLLAGCDLFRLRDPDPPVKPAPWNNYATSWDLCLQNLEYCYEDSRNAVKYSGLFTSDFSFHFAAQDINDYSLSPTWNSAQEQDMLLNLFTQNDSVLVTLNTLPSQPDQISATDAKIYRSYALLRYPRNNQVAVHYGGNLEIHLRKSGAYWYIYKWYDYRVSMTPTWGRMKSDYAP